MDERKKMPPRRPSMTCDVVWQREVGAHQFSVTIGFDPETGQLREVFASGARGSDMDAMISDACVVLSHALQWGADLKALSSSMLKVTDRSSDGGTYLHASVLGAIVEAAHRAQMSS